MEKNMLFKWKQYYSTDKADHIVRYGVVYYNGDL